ncbi:hypothetical protein JTP77_021765 [Streptomyces sp. S9]|nr:hypothetical protein [Streptomyces sp. S9]
MTRRGIFDYLCSEGGPSWGRLNEIDFQEDLYDLDGLASTASRFTTATACSTGSTTHWTFLTIGSSRTHASNFSTAPMTCFRLSGAVRPSRGAT